MHRGVQIVADALSRQHSGILEVFQLALRRGVALAGFVGQRHIVFPCGRGRLLGLGEKLGGVGGAHQGVPQAHLGKAHLLQSDNGGHALLVHLGQPHDEFLNRASRVGVPQGLEFLGGQPGHPGEVLQGFAVGFHGHLHFDHGLAERRAARLSLEAHGGQRRREAQNLRLRQAHLRTGSGQPRSHVHDGGFGGGVVVAQIDQCGTEPSEIRLRHLRNVGKLGDSRGGLVRGNVGRIAQVDHGAGKFHQIIILNAQLPGIRHDLGNVGGVGGHLGAHLFDRVRKLPIFGLRRVHGFAHGGEGALVFHRGLDRRRAQRQHGRGERSGHALAQLFHGGADGRALFPEGRQRIARLRPCGLHPGKALGGRANLLLGLPKRALRVVQICAGLCDRVRVVLQAFCIGRQLALQLFDLGGGIGILLRQRVQIGLGGQRRGIRLAQLTGKAFVLLCGRGHLLPEISVFLLGRVQ